MNNNQTLGMKKKLFFYTIMFLIPFVFFILFYLTYAAYKTAHIYQNIKTKQRGWRGNAHAAHPELGFAPIPNSQGFHVFPIGPDIPMRYDEDGFRVPVDISFSPNKRPIILALGCSFTYGDATLAEDTFPYLVGLSLNGTSKNAGVCGYGLCQMLLLARKLVPIFKPDYLLVQYSTWLVDRAQNPFAPTYYGKLPVPFFYEKDFKLEIYPPVFLTKITELPIDRYQNTTTGWVDKFSFYWSVGLPLSVHDDFNMLIYSIRNRCGIIPKPTHSREKIIRYVFSEINKVANEYGSTTVVVVLGNTADPVKVNEKLFPSDALLVNAHDSLLGRLESVSTENYQKEYAHWRDSPPVVVDEHPNEVAHRIIADAIVSAIKNTGSKTQ